ncbi:glycoside hydrolase family 43 protein [Plantactinospora siamensis]|uniref:Glycoside hydrolase family 43 protein n=1 Tax=Plantactinospora siamensis TaxID=555372 RepID=A0ABV6NYI2_9ACTN
MLTAVPPRGGQRPARRAGRLLSVLAVAALAAGCSSAPRSSDPSPGPSGSDQSMFTNPVLRTDSPDPQAIRVADTWYLFSTNAGGANIPVRTSTDLVSWAAAGDALPEVGRWADAGKTWAPEVIALAEDRYVAYYTAADRRSGRQCIGRAVASKPTGPYVDDAAEPLICQADQGGSIDASPFRDDDGTLWLVWKNDGNAIGADTWLWSQRLSPDGLRLTGSPAKLLRQTEAWEGAVIEGPFLHRHDGKLYLFYAANAYDKAEYAEGYAVCESPTGPCVKAAENPILRSNGAASGPGHASMVSKDGRDWLIYHAWPPGAEGAVDPGRQVWLDEVTWAAGKPTVHGPTAAPQRKP